MLVGQVQAPEGILRRRVVPAAVGHQGADARLDDPEAGQQVGRRRIDVDVDIGVGIFVSTVVWAGIGHLVVRGRAAGQRFLACRRRLRLTSPGCGCACGAGCRSRPRGGPALLAGAKTGD